MVLDPTLTHAIVAIFAALLAYFLPGWLGKKPTPAPQPNAQPDLANTISDLVHEALDEWLDNFTQTVPEHGEPQIIDTPTGQYLVIPKGDGKHELKPLATPTPPAK